MASILTLAVLRVTFITYTWACFTIIIFLFSFLPGGYLGHRSIFQMYYYITIIPCSLLEFALMFFIGSVDYELRAFAEFSD